MSEQSPQPEGAPTPIQVDDSGLPPMYTNFCRVTGTPEELMLDFGLNPEPFGRSATPIKLQQRMVMNFYTAKRLLGALHVAVQRYEKTFGPLEMDINKRVRMMTSGPGEPAPPSQPR